MRRYGFLEAGRKVSLDAVRWLVSLHYVLVYLLWSTQLVGPALPRLRSPDCGGALVVTALVLGWAVVYFDTS